LRATLIRLLDFLRIRPWARHQVHRVRWFLNRQARRADAELRRSGAPDGLPLPPVELVYMVSGGYYDSRSFLENGAVGAECITAILKKNSIDIAAARSILDFGCGCGRVLRNWSKLGRPEIHGCDYNPAHVAWCREAFPFARFEVNGLTPPLSYPDQTFDLIYTISVFTHLPVEQHRPWMVELQRVLRPGGALLLTFHSESRLAERKDIAPEVRERFRRGEPVALADAYAGTNVCATYFPETYARGELAAGLRVLDIVPGGAKDASQDVLLLAKAESAATPAS
jgi:SAM-dependent methyltransferase